MKHKRRASTKPGSRAPFDARALLAAVPEDRTIREYRKGEAVFTQGDPADAV